MKFDKNNMQQRNLPHIYPKGATFFITFCLHNAIPKKLSSKMKDKYDLEISEVLRKKLSKDDEK